MTQPKKCIATNSLCGWLLTLCMAPALAGTAVGTVTQVNGPLLLKRADGSIKAITLNSFVEQGDTLVTEKNTYAQLKFADDSEVTLRPDTQLKIEVLVYNAAAANNMDTVFSLAKGAVQIRTGAAARANPENIRLAIPSLLDPVSTIVLNRKEGTSFVAEFVVGPAETRFARFDSRQLAALYPAVQLASAESSYRTDAPLFSLPRDRDAAQQLAQLALPTAPKSSLPAGLYVSTTSGQIQMTNSGGTLQFAAGQFGYTPNPMQPPVLVPKNPGIQFTLPPAFQSSTAPQSGTSSSKPKTVDCEVR
ncbi:MAG: FecR domain-containing protein [Pseudomonadota bacterium]